MKMTSTVLIQVCPMHCIFLGNLLTHNWFFYVTVGYGVSHGFLWVIKSSDGAQQRGNKSEPWYPKERSA